MPNLISSENEIRTQSLLKPFLGWAGGKFRFRNKILQLFPNVEDIDTYYEPFLGAASLYLAYKPQKAKLSDLNEALINCFISVREKPNLVYNYLCEFIKQNSHNFYYKIRDEYNQFSNSHRRAARFIFLNKTSFNGIFRVNKEGLYNVPYGYKKNINWPKLEDLKGASELFKNAEVLSGDYKKVLESVNQTDFVYLDPPYPPINGSSYFTHYTKERFSTDDQIELAGTAKKLSNRGVRVLISNADIKLIRDLYNDWSLIEFERPRYVTSAKVKHKVSELLIYNY